MDMLQGKHFSITDPKGVSTVIYQIYKTKKEFLKEYPKYTVERLECSEEIRGESRRKTFYVDDPQPQGNQLAILSFAGDKVIINSGVLIDDEVTSSSVEEEDENMNFVVRNQTGDSDICEFVKENKE